MQLRKKERERERPTDQMLHSLEREMKNYLGTIIYEKERVGEVEDYSMRERI